MSDPLSLANRALLSIGARQQVSSIDPSDGSVEANAISVLWEPTFEQLARAAQWNCLTKQISLSLLQAAQGTPENVSGTTFPLAPSPWLYAYSYPSDCLAARYIVPSLPSAVGATAPATTINNAAATWLPQGGQILYEVATVQALNGTPVIVILTNQSQAQLVYTARYSNPSLWDSQFQSAFVAALAAYLVPALSLSLPLMQLSIQTAERIIGQARAADGREGVTVMDHLPDWIRARAGGGGFGLGYNISTWGGYVNMAWPAYGEI